MELLAVKFESEKVQFNLFGMNVHLFTDHQAVKKAEQKNRYNE